MDVTVVVPTCGRPFLLGRCLASLMSQRFDPTRYEIIIVDDRPSASTREIVQRWRRRVMSREGPSLVYLRSHGPHGPAAARNLGWRAARGDIVAFTDDDTVADPDWLSHGLAAFSDGVDVVRGRIVMPLAGVPTDYERDAQRLETAEFVTANCLCRKRVLEAVNGFDERFRLAWREDSDLHFRLLDYGARIITAPDAVIVHPVRPASWGVSLFQTKKIQFDALLYKKHPQRYRERIRAAPRWDYYLIVVGLLGCLFALLTGHYSLAAVAGLVWLCMTGYFCMQRLRHTSRSPSHVLEMIVTSVLIPPVAVYWRVVGAWRYRAMFL